MNKKQRIGGLAVACFLLVGSYFSLELFGINPDQSIATPGNDIIKPQPIIINEAVRTLLYLPLYHAQHHGLFQDQGLEVTIVTAGSATNSFASMLSGESDFSQADPMYVPISRAQGSDAVVVGQVLGRISLWGITREPSVETFDRDALLGKTISTHPRPMSAYTYTKNLLVSLGLNDEQTTILQSKPGSEIVPLMAGKSQFAVTIEPAASIAEAKGARVIYSFPDSIGARVFTAVMARRELLEQRPQLADRVYKAYDLALRDMHNNPAKTLQTATAYFPQIDEQVLARAVGRLLSEEVFPRTARISRDSWDGAVQARIDAGDLKGPAPYKDNVLLLNAE